MGYNRAHAVSGYQGTFRSFITVIQFFVVVDADDEARYLSIEKDMTSVGVSSSIVTDWLSHSGMSVYFEIICFVQADLALKNEFVVVLFIFYVRG